LDCTTDIFIWAGANCTLAKKVGGKKCANLFYESYDRPTWSKIWEVNAGMYLYCVLSLSFSFSLFLSNSLVYSGSEPPLFTSHFKDWPEPKVTQTGHIFLGKAIQRVDPKKVDNKEQEKAAIAKEIPKFFNDESFEIKEAVKNPNVNVEVSIIEINYSFGVRLTFWMQVFAFSHKTKSFKKLVGKEKLQFYRKDCNLVLAAWPADGSKY
jgi:hypothetical protein